MFREMLDVGSLLLIFLQTVYERKVNKFFYCNEMFDLMEANRIEVSKYIKKFIKVN